MSLILWIVVALIAVVVFWMIAIYNGLIKLKNRTNEAWSDIDVQLKRRYDLIPNLIETVKGYAQHERELFEKVTQARTAAMGAQNATEKAQTLHVLNKQMLVEMLNTTHASVAAISEYGFAIESPNVSPTAFYEKQEFLNIITSRYNQIETISDFGQAYTELNIYKLK